MNANLQSDVCSQLKDLVIKKLWSKVLYHQEYIATYNVHLFKRGRSLNVSNEKTLAFIAE